MDLSPWLSNLNFSYSIWKKNAVFYYHFSPAFAFSHGSPSFFTFCELDVR